jgi:phospholipid transport system transporter-binding protein
MRRSHEDQADSIQVREPSPGHITLRGRLALDTATYAYEQGLAIIQAEREERIEIDCSRVTKVDSAGLAVLIDWMAAARVQGHRLCVTHVPAELAALAKISEVEEILERGVDCGARAVKS